MTGWFDCAGLQFTVTALLLATPKTFSGAPGAAVAVGVGQLLGIKPSAGGEAGGAPWQLWNHMPCASAPNPL